MQIKTELPQFVDSLKMKLLEDLPGLSAQLKMVPAYKKFPNPFKDFKEPIPAAVLICLYPENGNWKFILTERTDTVEFHRNQISLPGGAKEKDESFEKTALRESYEEIGLDGETVNVIGELSPLLIPVSGFLVHPFVGWIESEPDLTPAPEEVKKIYFASVNDLLNDANLKREMRNFRGMDIEVPYYYINGIKVWGATAAILSELREIIRGLM
tara:strand:+ start:21519 stop:22157 length:639 start_codon:yes stop_codon:yes gene_type:complete